MRRLAFLLCALLGVVVFAEELQIVSREVLCDQRFELGHSDSRTFVAKKSKLSSEPQDKGVHYALHLKTFIKNHKYQDGWSMLLQMEVHGRPVARFNDVKQKRLINHDDAIYCRGKGNARFQGELWYAEYFKAWNVPYGKDFAPIDVFCPDFDYDVTDYVFDIDDLVVVDEPLEIKLINIASQRRDIMELNKKTGRMFPLVFGLVEILQVKVEERAAATIELPAPSQEQTVAFHNRIRKFQDFSTDKYVAELDNLRFAEENFSKCKRHEQFDGKYLGGHLWLAYGSGNVNAPSFEPMLAEAEKYGVKLVKVHAHWASIDDKSPFNPYYQASKDDFRKLIEMCHKHGMKFVAYTSPSWTKPTDEYNPAWQYSDKNAVPSNLKKIDWLRCCTGSVEWRSYFFSNVQKLFDTYPVDGIYVDYGIYPPFEVTCNKPDHHHAFQKNPNVLASGHDMLRRLYALCQKNNKILYLFAESIPNMEDCCDFQCCGESTQSMPAYRARHANFKSNMFLLSMPHRYTYYSLREMYSSTMAYGHFPVFCNYTYLENKKLLAEDKAWFYYFLPVWNAMTQPGTHLYREISETPAIGKIPENTAVSAFVNTDIYVVFSNFGEKNAKFSLKQPMENLENGETVTEITVPANDLMLMRFHK